MDNNTEEVFSQFDPERWGLPLEAVKDLGNRLYSIWERFHDCFTTQRHDKSENALTYLKGLLLMPGKRNYANIARTVGSPEEDGQNLQHHISESPWGARNVFGQIQTEIKQDERLQSGMLSLDESGDVRYGDKSAGASRQYIGNVGKIELGQVGVALGYYAAGVWTMVDAELFLPEVWFDEEHKKEFKRLHIPEDRELKTKLEIGLDLVDRASANGLPFNRFSCDSLYGRSHDFRAEIDRRGIPYIADIPCDLNVYLEKPETGIPPKTKNKGRQPTRWKVLNEVKPIEVRQIANSPEINFEPIEIRSCERGKLIYDCAKTSVWTITSDGTVRQEQLFIRKESDGQITYSLSNEPDKTPLNVLANWRSERFFVERVFEDAKSEGGWDEFEAQKYRAWMHHAALTALALWFIALTKLDWREKYPPDSELAGKLEIEKLPALSMANIRLLLQAVMPLKQLTVEQAIDLVVKHLVNRSNSTRSRLKSQKRNKSPT